MSTLLNLQQAADRAGVTRRTLYNWLHAQKVAAVKVDGFAPRIVAASLWRRSARKPHVPKA